MKSTVDTGRDAEPDTGPEGLRGRHVSLAGGRISLRAGRRGVLVGLLLAGLVVLVGLLALGIGEVRLPLGDVLGAFTGQSDPGTTYIVLVLRLPRILTALCVGVALGVSGAVFQSLTRNPLGSPDIIGFNAGASVAAVFVIVAVGVGTVQVALAAMVGGLVTAVAVYLLAFRGGVAGYRLILVGIGMNAMLLALVEYLLTRANLDEAQTAQVWLVGSLNARGWEHVVPIAAALAVLLPVTFALSRRLNLMEMGDEAARALGVRVEPSRLLLILLGVALCGVATASAGPIAFVALTAPQLARRLTRSTGAGLLCAGLMGGLLLLAADLGTQLLSDYEMPVGVLTGALGGIYLAWLLSREWKANRS